MRHGLIAAVVWLLATPAIAQENIRTVPDQDAFTDEDRSRVVVYADEQPFWGRDNAVVWRCNGPDTYELYVVNEEFLGGDTIPIVYRFDSNSARSERWNDSTSGTGAFAHGVQKQRFTAAAVEATRLAVGLTDYRGQRYEYMFSLTGLRGALDGLGCVLPPPEREGVESDLSVAEAYEVVKQAVEGESYTEGLNVMFFDGLTVRFANISRGTLLDFEGSNTDLYRRIRNEFR